MKFSKLVKNINEGYDLNAINNQMERLFNRKLYAPVKVKIEDGTPVCFLDVPVKRFNIHQIKVALSDREDKVVISMDLDYNNIKECYGTLDGLKSFIKDNIESVEDQIIDILKSK